MLRPPPIQMISKLPITGGIAILAILVTLAWNAGVDLSAICLEPFWYPKHAWAILTSMLPHVGYFHLLFNIYWLWVFGSILELRVGHLPMLLIVILLQIVAAAAQYAFDSGGVGLSGVGYGLFAFFWVMSRRDGWFVGAIDQQTVGLFVGWFILCIILTQANAWAVANVAHGAGAVAGAMLAMAVKARMPAARKAWAAGLFVLAIGLCLLASVAWPMVNRSRQTMASVGYQALVENRNLDASRICQRAIELDPADARSWHNLGIACDRLGRRQEAHAAYLKASELNPSLGEE